MADFLFEIGLEEIPARMIGPAEAELAKRVTGLLERERLWDSVVVFSRLSGRDKAEVAQESVKTYSTPRRIAVLVRGVAAKQEDVTEELVGPSAKIAFKDGKPGPAAEAFAKKAGIAASELKTITTPKGEYVAATVKRAGRMAAEVLAEALPKEISGIYWAKNMYWRAGKPEHFVRPVRWLLALLDGAVVPVEFAGFTAGAVSYGHRVLHGETPVAIAKPTEYADALKKAHVMVDVAERRQTIRKALDAATRTVAGARWREDEYLVETVTNLTEWPSVVLGNFEPEYLTLPEEVLVTVMRDHQKYFAVEDAAGKLAPHFLAVLNTEADAAGQEVIRHGNARVLRARFNDARFFWDYDQKIPLTERVEMLKTVTFQKDLGSYFAKTEAVGKLSAELAAILGPKGVRLEAKSLALAALLAKTDLTTELVKEFTELQGVVGGLYARAQGCGEATAAAIYAQYQPAGMDAAIPATVEGQVFGIADRMNTIVDMFAIGLAPTGSKDPFALRRAANGVVKILAESELPLTLPEILQAAIANSTHAKTDAASVSSFLAERLEFYLREVKAQAYDVVKAVLAGGADDVRDAVARAEAVTAVRGSADFAAVCATFKRTVNLLQQTNEVERLGDLDAGLLVVPAEQRLYSHLNSIRPEWKNLVSSGRYIDALNLAAGLREDLDSFFNAVIVMIDDSSLRVNRIALLMRLIVSFRQIAEFSEIVT